MIGWKHLALLCLLGFATAPAQNNTTTPNIEDLTLATDAVAPRRFVAAHGRRAVLMGYSTAGLEAWAYPFQLFTHYHVRFLLPGSPLSVEGGSILRRIEYHPDEIVRIYSGPGFQVREHLFVSLDQPAVLLSYDIEGRTTPDLEITFLPVLDLMWPAALGGQDLQWSDPLHGYIISEQTTGFRAVIASPQSIAHTAPVNATLRQDFTQTIVLHPANGHAELFAVLERRPAPEGAVLRSLEQNEPELRQAYRAHAAEVLTSGLQIRTPDAELNRALHWSRLALDQAWVCNPEIGCGTVGGYGPSRPIRRPQYAWYFTDDGLIATEADLALGNMQRAHDELDFIFRYQNPSNGMIWHEITQSAAFLDWAGKYPYLYVHVDVTYAFLRVLADNYEQSGDLSFLQQHWKQIQAAWDYSRSLINPETRFPELPAGKEGGNEQDRMREDVSLSAAWISASDSFARLALATGHTAEAADATAAARAARQVFATRYWDAMRDFWIAGYTENGSVMTDERSHVELLGNGLFSPEHEDAALDRLASSTFETDWGTRTMSSASPRYDPNSYAGGSVFGVATAGMAESFWRDHRPAIAWPILESLLPWLRLDSLGHMHEVLAGDVYQPQIESVPEQTWSSSGLIESVVRGIFGLSVNAPAHSLTLAPHLPPGWDRVSLDSLVVGASRIAASIDQQPEEVDLTLRSQGDPVHLTFAPEIPLGATAVHALLDGHAIAVAIERHTEDTHARVDFDLPAGGRQCRILFSGGVRLVAPKPDPVPGGRSLQLKLTAFTLSGDQLTLDADVADAQHASIDLQSPWTPGAIHGGSAVSLGGGRYRLTFLPADHSPQSPFVRQRMTVQLHRAQDPR